jgi:hypothetical protein
VSTIRLKTEHKLNNTTQFNRTSKKDGGAQQAKENNLADGTDNKRNELKKQQIKITEQNRTE